MSHFAGDEIQRFNDDSLEEVVTGDLPGVEVGAHQLRIIVKHFFEVGDKPGIVSAVAREAATHDIIHPTARHGLERVECCLKFPSPWERGVRGEGRFVCAYGSSE